MLTPSGGSEGVSSLAHFSFLPSMGFSTLFLELFLEGLREVKLSNLRLRLPVSLLFKDKTWAGYEDAGWNRAFFSTWGTLPCCVPACREVAVPPG